MSRPFCHDMVDLAGSRRRPRGPVLGARPTTRNATSCSTSAPCTARTPALASDPRVTQTLTTWWRRAKRTTPGYAVRTGPPESDSPGTSGPLATPRPRPSRPVVEPSRMGGVGRRTCTQVPKAASAEERRSRQGTEEANPGEPLQRPGAVARRRAPRAGFRRRGGVRLDGGHHGGGSARTAARTQPWAAIIQIVRLQNREGQRTSERTTQQPTRSLARAPRDAVVDPSSERARGQGERALQGVFRAPIRSSGRPEQRLLIRE